MNRLEIIEQIFDTDKFCPVATFSHVTSYAAVLRNKETYSAWFNSFDLERLIKKATKHGAKTFTFKVGSLIDKNPSDYVAICNQQGEVIGHEYNGKQFHKQEDEVPEKPETENPNQLSIF